MAKIDLNFKPDVPNNNGRIYPKETLEEALAEKIASPGGLLVYDSVDNIGRLSHVVGSVKEIDIDGDAFSFNIKVKDPLLLQSMNATISGYGRIDDSGVVRDLKISGVGLIKK